MKVSDFKSLYLETRTIKVRLWPTPIQAEKLMVYSRRFEEIANYARANCAGMGYDEAHRHCRKVFNEDNRLTQSAIHFANRTGNSVKITQNAFQSVGPLISPSKACLSGYHHVPTNRTEVILPGFGRKESIKTDATTDLPLYHLITVFQEDGNWHAFIDIKPKHVSNESDYVNREMDIQRYQDTNTWQFNGKNVTKNDLLNKSNFTYRLELAADDGRIYFYIGSHTIKSKKYICQTMRYQGSGGQLYFARKKCVLKTIKKTILTFHDSKEESDKAERDLLSAVSKLPEWSNYLNSSTGKKSADIFSMKHFVQKRYQPLPSGT